MKLGGLVPICQIVSADSGRITRHSEKDRILGCPRARSPNAGSLPYAKLTPVIDNYRKVPEELDGGLQSHICDMAVIRPVGFRQTVTKR
jgi:hypothetical protein